MLARCRIPTVLFARRIANANLDYVGADNVLGAEMAVEHLIRLGHRRIAFIGGPAQTTSRIERLTGYRAAHAKHDLPVDETLLGTSLTTREGGYRAALTVLRADPRPTAAMCFNDVVAFGVMLALAELGQTPGQDCAVVGFDDIAEAALAQPALTTVATAPGQIGAQAANLLLARITNPDLPPQQVILPPRLVIRESCGFQYQNRNG
jgi:LacI family transcriptional regulator